jgi:hypothetical protein
VSGGLLLTGRQGIRVTLNSTVRFRDTAAASQLTSVTHDFFSSAVQDVRPFMILRCLCRYSSLRSFSLVTLSFQITCFLLYLVKGPLLLDARCKSHGFLAVIHYTLLLRGHVGTPNSTNIYWWRSLNNRILAVPHVSRSVFFLIFSSFYI